MQIRVSGKHMDVGDSLRNHVEGRLTEGVNKYLDRVVEVSVVFHKEAHQFTADISLNTATHSHVTVKASAHAADPYVCFDAAADKVEKQLRRYKRKLKSHTEARKAREESKEFVKYVFSGHEEEVAEDNNPVVIAEQNYALEKLSVSEAVMRLDLEDLPTLMFVNSKHGGLNVVYRRQDGNIAWLDPEQSAKKEPLRKAS